MCKRLSLPSVIAYWTHTSSNAHHRHLELTRCLWMTITTATTTHIGTAVVARIIWTMLDHFVCFVVLWKCPRWVPTSFIVCVMCRYCLFYWHARHFVVTACVTVCVTACDRGMPNIHKLVPKEMPNKSGQREGRKKGEMRSERFGYLRCLFLGLSRTKRTFFADDKNETRSWKTWHGVFDRVKKTN